MRRRMSTRHTFRRRRYAVMLGITLLSLVELGARLTLPDPRVVGYGQPALDEALTYDPTAPVVVTTSAGARTFARGGSRMRPQAWSAMPPASTYRIVVVGDSTVHGLLTDVMQAGLVVPDRNVEVLNFGLGGAGTDRVRLLARAAYEQLPAGPDGARAGLVVIYTGHNETAELQLNPHVTRSMASRALVSRMLHSGVGRALGALGLIAAPEARFAGASGKGDALHPAGSPAELESQVRAATAQATTHLEALCAEAHAAGATVAFVEPVSSLRHPGVLAADASSDLRTRLDESVCQLRAEDATAALASSTALTQRYPDAGPAWAVRGAALLALNRRDEAVEALLRARSLDADTARAPAPLTDAIARVAASCGAPFVVTEATLLQDPRSLADGDPLFVDRVLPSRDGNAALAEIIVRRLAMVVLPTGARFEPSRVTLPTHSTERDRALQGPPDAFADVTCPAASGAAAADAVPQPVRTAPPSPR